MQGTWVPSLVLEDPTCCGATKPMHHSYWARTLQLLSSRALEPWSPQPPHPGDLEPPHPRALETPRPGALSPGTLEPMRPGALEPTCPGAPAPWSPQLPCPGPLEPTCCRAPHALQQGKSPPFEACVLQWRKSSPCSLQPRENLHAATETQHCHK